MKNAHVQFEGNVGSDIEDFIAALRKAVKEKDKRSILALYDLAKIWDFDNAPSFIGEEYDELVDKGNDILYDIG